MKNSKMRIAVSITLLITFNVVTTNILVVYVILSRVHLSNISSSFFNVFLNQNYELQLSCNLIITCNNKQYMFINPNRLSQEV
jgi:hypothetical protein